MLAGTRTAKIRDLLMLAGTRTAKIRDLLMLAGTRTAKIRDLLMLTSVVPKIRIGAGKNDRENVEV